MKTTIAFAVFILLLPLMTGCSDGAKKNDNVCTRFNIEYQGQSQTAGLKIRFNSVKKKDEATLAMETAAGRWSRNLYLSGGYDSLDEYVVAYGQNP
jgi:hypothetical protein